jgi:arginase family enzyme
MNSCSELVKPDVVMELGWRANLMDFAMPFMINTVYEQNRKVLNLYTSTNKISALETWVEEKKKEAQAQQQQEEETPIMLGGQRLIGYGGVNGYVS